MIRELDVECNECARHAITDEASGASYDLVSDPRAPAGGVDLRLYVGQRVTIHGVPQLVGPPNLLFVTRVESAPTPGAGTLPSTGGPSLLLPIIASILGGGIMMGLRCCDAAGKNSKSSHLSEGRGHPGPLQGPLDL